MYDFCKKNHKITANGSFTVEATLVTPIFFIFIIILLYFFKIIYLQNEHQINLYNSAYEYQCFNTRISTIKNLFENKSVIIWDEDDKRIYINNRINIPFISNSLFGIRQYVSMNYTEFKGESMVSYKDNDYVYITNNSSVYHTDIHCKYLEPDISSCTYKECNNKRNNEGKIYRSCEYCKKEMISDYDTVFITPYGTKYHNTIACPSLKRVVMKINIDRAAKLNKCSKCK